ncbi:MAG: type II secretion system minor pseudopilin GspI [Hyphomonas sp.]
MNTASDPGFSLAEVIAALGIFSIAALGLIKLNNETIRGASQVNARAYADLVASSQIADAMSDPDLTAGLRTGTTTQRGSEYNWAVSITPTNTFQVNLIDVSVSDPQSGQVYTRVQALKAITP